MEAKELKKLSRSELLEMLLDRSKEVEHLRKELDETKKHIQTLEREVKTSGDINAAINKLTSATEEIQKFAAVISMASNNLQTKIGTAVLSKAMDTNEALGQGLVQMIDSAAMERSVTPELGANIDLRL